MNFMLFTAPLSRIVKLFGAPKPSHWNGGRPYWRATMSSNPIVIFETDLADCWMLLSTREHIAELERLLREMFQPKGECNDTD